MTSNQESRFSMQLVARDYLLQNAAITATLPNFSIYFDVVQSDITQVAIIRQQQDLDKKGITTNKRLLRINLTAQALDISRKVVAYATYINNQVLLDEVNYTETDLKNYADTIFKDNCQIIYTHALENIAPLQPYGVTDTVLTTFLNTINNYNTAITEPRLGTLNTKEATRQLALLLKNIDQNYAKIDTLIEIVRTSQSKFYHQYKSSRRIIYTVHQLIALTVSVKDTNGNPIPKISAIITNIPKNPNSKEVINEISKKTTQKGAFRITNLAEGSYKATLSKLEYTTQSINFTVVSGETTRLNLIMINEI